MAMNLKFLRLPGSYNFKSSIKPLPIKQVQQLLGSTFFPRVSQIFNNTLQSISSYNTSFLSSSLSPSLLTYLIKKRNDLKQKGYRVRIYHPNKLIIPTKMRKWHKMWKSQNIAIGLESKVYFGMKFQHDKPNNQGKNIRQIHTGRNRVFCYDQNLTIKQNIINLYKQQTYQFRIRLVTSTHMKIFDANNKPLYLDDQSDQFQQKGLQNTQKQIETEMLMRSGNDKFNWVVIDINGIMANRGKA